MNDALRTAQSKGLTYETIQQMQVDYRKRCSEEEQEARMKMSKDGWDKRVDQRQADREAQVSQAQEQNRTAAKQQQCIESRRILMNKNARNDLTEGEKADLARFEENFRARCGG
jgi:selenocysteine-specific translation elongation factor